MFTCYQLLTVGRITKRNQHQILYCKRNEQKEGDAWGNDENTPSEQENEEKEDEMGKWWWCSPWQCLS